MKHIAFIIVNLLLIGTLGAMQRPQFDENGTFTAATTVDTSGDEYDCCTVPAEARLVKEENMAVRAKSAAVIRKLEASLIGKWENTIYPFEVDDAGIIPGAFLRYHFAKDGTYTKVVGNNTLSVKESGSWFISADGNFVIMEAADGSYSEAMIKLLQLDEMVLEHELKVKDPAFCTKQKAFFFNKQ